MNTKLKGIARKLQEFSWLWAVKGNDAFEPEWTETTVKVLFATKARFDQDIFGQGDAWVYGLDQNGVPILRHAVSGWDHRLGSVALYGAVSGLRGSRSAIGERLEYVALKSRDGKNIVVLRPPKGKTMWQFLQQYDPHAEKRE